VTDIPDSVTDRFDALAQASMATHEDLVSVGQKWNPTSAVRHRRGHLHPVDAEQFMNRKLITLGAESIWLLPNSASSSFKNHFPSPLMIQSRNR